MQGHFWHLCLTQLFMLFCMVASVLLSMVAFITIFLLVKILQQLIRIFEISGYLSCHWEQYAGYPVKEHKKLGQKLVSKVTLHFIWCHLSKKQTVHSFATPLLKNPSQPLKKVSSQKTSSCGSVTGVALRLIGAVLGLQSQFKDCNANLHSFILLDVKLTAISRNFSAHITILIFGKL